MHPFSQLIYLFHGFECRGLFDSYECQIYFPRVIFVPVFFFPWKEYVLVQTFLPRNLIFNSEYMQINWVQIADIYVCK
jgi:hypothetical protein